MTLTQEEAFARIRLLRSPNVGPVSYAQLLRRFGDAQAAVDAPPDLASRGGRDYRPAPRDRIENEVAEARPAGALYLFHDSPDYPALLGETDGARDPDRAWRHFATKPSLRGHCWRPQCFGGRRETGT